MGRGREDRLVFFHGELLEGMPQTRRGFRVDLVFTQIILEQRPHDRAHLDHLGGAPAAVPIGSRLELRHPLGELLVNGR